MVQVSYIDEVSYNCHIRLGIEASIAEPHLTPEVWGCDTHKVDATSASA
jgi:hypothetical protein